MKALLVLVACLVGCGGSPRAGHDGGGVDDAGSPDAAPVEGVIGPDRPQAELDDAVAAAYDAWKASYLEPACTAGHYRVKTTPATGAYTVSEGHAYGMLATVLMADHDPDARTLFDGLYAYFAAHPSQNDPGLMAWAQDESCANVDGPSSATDGDLDIAYALLLADARWGSAGDVDYGGAADQVIAAILASEVHPSDTILIGDWAGPSDPHHTGTRPSDLMPGHFRAFGAASGVARWTDVVDKTFDVIAALQTDHAPATGLLPDFAIDATGASPSPAPAGWLEGANDGSYAYNACRTPWRIALDVLISGEPRARAAVRAINAWIRAETGDDPAQIVNGYRLDGTPYGGGLDLAFVAPFAVGAMVEPATGTNQPWLDALWDQVVGAGSDGYYGDSIRLLAMIAMSGHWRGP